MMGCSINRLAQAERDGYPSDLLHVIRRVSVDGEILYVARYTWTARDSTPKANYFPLCAPDIDEAMTKAAAIMSMRFRAACPQAAVWYDKNDAELRDLSVHRASYLDMVNLAETLMGQRAEKDANPIQKFFYFPDGVGMRDLSEQRKTLVKLEVKCAEDGDEQSALNIECLLRLLDAMFSDWVMVSGEDNP